jgi:hypothetical protein
MAVFATARTAGFMPGESPPEVKTAMIFAAMSPQASGRFAALKIILKKV